MKVSYDYCKIESAAGALWREVENELRRIGMIEFKLKMDSDYDKCIDELRRVSIPIHLVIVPMTAKKRLALALSKSPIGLNYRTFMV